MSTGWNSGSIAAVAAAGNLTQLYPSTCTAGSGATTQGTEVRRPCDGTLISCQVETDGVNGGKLELWDVDGSDGGADVNTAAAITNAQLTAAIAKGRARLVYEQTFLGTSGARLNLAGGMPIARGLAARFSNAGVAGTITLSIVSRGLFMKTQICG